MNPSPLSFRTRIAVLAIVAIAWLATRDAPTDGNVQAGASQAGASASAAVSPVVVAGSTSRDAGGH